MRGYCLTQYPRFFHSYKIYYKIIMSKTIDINEMEMKLWELLRQRI